MKSCPICKTDQYNTRLMAAASGEILICGKCGLGMFDGPMPPQVGGDIEESASFRWIKRRILNHEFGYLRHRRPMRLLEIGSGSGELASFLQSFGHQVACCDVGRGSLDGIARRYGMQTFCGTIEDVDLGDLRFDGIVMRHVFEHLDNPDGILQKLCAHLNPNGRLFFSQPNLDSWCRKLSPAEWNWTVPYHRFFWSENTLTAYLQGKGFRVVKARSVFSHFGLPMGLCRIVPAGAARRLLMPVLAPVGTLAEIAAVWLHQGQNLFLEAEYTGQPV